MTIKSINNIAELFSLNVISLSVSTWIFTTVGSLSTTIACLVGLSVLILNGFKIYGVILDNKKKRK